MKQNIFFLIFLFFSLISFSQQKKIIIAKDTQNKYNKSLRLISIYNEKYYANFVGDSALIKNNQYTFNIPTYDIPRPFRFLFKTEKNKIFEISNVFYISKGINKINFNSEDKKIVFQKDRFLSKEIIDYDINMKCYSRKKKELDSIQSNIYKRKNFNVDKTTVDSLQRLYKRLDLYEDSLLLDLSKKTPKSYILFWKLVGKFESKGFKKEYLEMFNNLNLSIKKSPVGVIFNEELKKAEKIISGNVFPNLIFQNKNILSSLGKKYTIIDFWFSHCEPCLNDFPKYKEVYKQYKNKGFEIIGISTDQTKSIDDWKKVIKEKDLSWIHFLDENGMESKKYNINAFPTTFLLDSEGIIIKKNISHEELESFLKKNL